MRHLRIAAAQIHSGGTPAENLARLERQAIAAATVGAEAILFSECVIHGYGYHSDNNAPRVAALAEPLDGPSCRALSAIAARHGITIMAGFFERDGDAFYNTHCIATPDGKRDRQRKHMLTEGELNAGLRPGGVPRLPVILGGVRCAILICADGGLPDLAGILKDGRFEYRLCPTGGGGHIRNFLHETDLDTPEGRAAYEKNRPCVFNTNAILDISKEASTGFTSANALGPVGKETCHQGHCMIVDGRGVMRAQLPGTIVLEHQHDSMIHAVLSFA